MSFIGWKREQSYSKGSSLEANHVYNESKILKQGQFVLLTSQLPSIFFFLLTSDSKRKLGYKGGYNTFLSCFIFPLELLPSFWRMHDQSALLQSCPSSFKVPGIFFEPLEFSHGDSGGFTAQDALLTNWNTSVFGFWDIGRVCGNKSKQARKK